MRSSCDGTLSAMAVTPRGSLPERLEDLVLLRSRGRVGLAVDSVVGRHLVAIEDLPAGQPALVDESLLAGGNAARALRVAGRPDDVDSMLEAWDRPDDEVSGNPLAHVDVFCSYALLKAEAAVGSAEASSRVERIKTWFFLPMSEEVDRDEQTDKLQLVLDALRPELRRRVSLDELRHLDDVLSRNLEEFSAEATIMHGGLDGACVDATERPPWLGRRRYQGIFPCKDLVQHSCAPNCASVGGVMSSPRAVSEQLVLQLVPLVDIPKGTQLTWNYLPYWKSLWPTQMRRGALQETWRFLCGCVRCTGGAPERVVRYHCPSCESDGLCPSASCTVTPPDIRDTGELGVFGHAAALSNVAELRCCSCGECFPGSSIACRERLEHEVALLSVPDACCLLERVQREADRHLLAPTHFLFVDHASLVLENASKVAASKDLTCKGVDVARVNLLLHELAASADLVDSALIRALGANIAGQHTQLVWVRLYRALCTGHARDFESCLDIARQAWQGRDGTSAVMHSIDLICTSPHSFVSNSFAPAAVAAERVRVEAWLGRSAVSDESFSLWALRRMWLWPSFDFAPVSDNDSSDAENGALASTTSGPTDVAVPGPRHRRRVVRKPGKVPKRSAGTGKKSVRTLKRRGHKLRKTRDAIGAVDS